MPLVNALATHHMRRGRFSQREDLMTRGFSFTLQSAVSHPCLLPILILLYPFIGPQHPQNSPKDLWFMTHNFFTHDLPLKTMKLPYFMTQNGASVFEVCSLGPRDCPYTGPSSSRDCFPHLQLFIHCPIFSFKIHILVIPCLLDDRLEMKDKDWLTHFKGPLPVNLIKSISSTSHTITPWD